MPKLSKGYMMNTNSNRKDLIGELKRVATLCNSDTLTQTQFKEHGSMWPTTVEKHLGTWNKALKLAGLKALNRRRAWTKQDIYKEFARLEVTCKGRPTYDQFRGKARMNVCAVERQFGTLSKAWRWYQGMKAYIQSRTKKNPSFKHVWN